jgi:hypothetical protein
MEAFDKNMEASDKHLGRLLGDCGTTSGTIRFPDIPQQRTLAVKTGKVYRPQ